MAQSIPRAVSTCLRQIRASRTSARALAIEASDVSRHFTTDSPRNAAAAGNVIDRLRPPPDYVPPTKPPSARPTETRKTQMIRQYTSLLRSAPLILLFQHSNLTAAEWTAIRRELKKAIGAVPTSSALPGSDAPVDVAPEVRLEVLRTNMFKVAMKIVEFWDPEAAAADPSTPRTARGPLVHDLSETAYTTLKGVTPPEGSALAELEPVLFGPMAALTLPAVSPPHLAAALSILAPEKGVFSAPTRKKNPGYYDPSCQAGLQKLMLVGGRIEGKIFDRAGVNWVGGIEGGLDGLRAQLVGMLQGAGLGITNALEGGSRSLWLTLEGRKEQLDEKAEPKAEEKKEGDA